MSGFTKPVGYVAQLKKCELDSDGVLVGVPVLTVSQQIHRLRKNSSGEIESVGTVETSLLAIESAVEFIEEYLSLTTNDQGVVIECTSCEDDITLSSYFSQANNGSYCAVMEDIEQVGSEALKTYHVDVMRSSSNRATLYAHRNDTGDMYVGMYIPTVSGNPKWNGWRKVLTQEV